jgi:hypothetical protein
VSIFWEWVRVSEVVRMRGGNDVNDHIRFRIFGIFVNIVRTAGGSQSVRLLSTA